MIIVDKALEQRERDGMPIRVGMVGSGFMGKGIVLQIVRSVPGMRLVAIANRNLEKAKQAYMQAGVETCKTVESISELETAIQDGAYAVTEEPLLLCQAEGIDAIIEVTGTIEFGVRVVLKAIENRKHVILMNAELDGTVGPILKVYADRAGVVLTNCDGDQPGVIMNLYRFVKGLGVNPVLCGNIKGLHDPYRNPTTQEGFAKQWGQNPMMVTSFADGTKISFEQGIVANATGMRVARRGMFGPTFPAGTTIEETIDEFPLENLLEGPGIVDYVVGAVPSPGVFVLGTHDHPAQQHYLNLYKLGKGPLYCFYTPYHLCHFEVPFTVARAVLFGDATIAPIAGPVCDVMAVAKRDLKEGEILDGIGGYACYGLLENHQPFQEGNFLSIGLAEGSMVKRDIKKDEPLTYVDVTVPSGRLCDKLRAEQNDYFSNKNA